MFDFLKRLFASAGRHVELEAKLRPTAMCTYGGKGEVEVERYRNGVVKIEADIKHTALPDGSRAEVWFGGRCVVTLTVQGGYAKEYLRLEAEQAFEVPALGDTAEIRVDGNILYEGTFRRD